MVNGLLNFPRPGADPLIAYTVTVSPENNNIMGVGMDGALETLQKENARGNQSLADRINVAAVDGAELTATVTFISGLAESPPVIFQGDIENYHSQMRSVFERRMGGDMEIPLDIEEYTVETYSQGSFGGPRPLTDTPLEFTLFLPSQPEGARVGATSAPGEQKHGKLEEIPEIKSYEMTSTASKHKVQIKIQNNRISGTAVTGISDTVLESHIGDEISNYSFRAV